MTDSRIRALEREAAAEPAARARWMAERLRRTGAIEPVRAARVKTNSCHHAAFVDPDVLVTAASDERTVSAWRLPVRDDEKVGALGRLGPLRREPRYGGTQGMALSADGRWLVTCARGFDSAVLLAPITVGQGAEVRADRACQVPLPPHARREALTGCVAAAADRFLACTTRVEPRDPRGGNTAAVHVWTFPAGPEGAPARVAALDDYAPGERRLEATFSPDGAWVYAVLDERLDAWDLRGERPQRHTQPGAPGVDPTNVALRERTVTASSTLIVVGTNDGLVGWQVASGRPAQGPCLRLRTPAAAAAFSPDGTLLLTAPGVHLRRDGDVVLWWLEDPTAGKVRELARFPGRGPLAFSPDGARALCGGGPDAARATVWQLASLTSPTSSARRRSRRT